MAWTATLNLGLARRNARRYGQLSTIFILGRITSLAIDRDRIEQDLNRSTRNSGSESNRLKDGGTEEELNGDGPKR